MRYIAVRDKKGNYVGTLECVQKMGFAKEHFEEEVVSHLPYETI